MGELFHAAIGFPTMLFTAAARAGLPGFLSYLLCMALLLVASLLSWLVTRGLVRPPAKPFPDEPGPSRQDARPRHAAA